MEYRFDPSANKPGAAPALTAAAAAQVQVQVPFTLRAMLSITDHGGPSSLSYHLYSSDQLPRGIRADIHTARKRARGRRRRALSRLRSDGSDEHRRYRWRRVDVRACATHAALVPRLFRLYHLRHFPFRLRSGPHRDAPGYVREQRCTPAPCARGANLVRAAGGHAA